MPAGVAVWLQASIMSSDAEAGWDWPDKYDFFETTRLLRTGSSDPTLKREADGLWRAARTEAGPATVRITVRDGEAIEARAWGDGAAAALERVPLWLGLTEPAWQLPEHPVTDRLLHENPGVRLNDTGDVFEALVNVILHQQITWKEAAFLWRRVVEAFGEPAPGPGELRLLPEPSTLRRASIDRLAGLGIGRQRAVTLNEVAFSASRLQRAAELPTEAASGLLQKIRGVGPWTAAMVLGLRLARPEPIVFGDVHLPHDVCWALAREQRGSDERMAELLAPFDGHAFRIVRLIHAARIEAPRRAPKRQVRFGRRI